MTDASNLAQMHVRLSRFLPRDLARSLHPKTIDDACKVAWDNGWRDPEWLANYALEGTEHPSVRDASAVFASRLRDISSTPCPVEDTPAPGKAYIDPAPSGTPSRVPRTWAQKCRDAARRYSGTETA